MSASAPSSDPWPLLATVSFAVHLGAVGVWLFAIGASLLAPRTAVALAVFTPAAVGAAVGVAGTGLVNAILQLSEPGELFSTGYGWALLGIGAVLVAMVVLGMVHVRAREPAWPEAASATTATAASAAPSPGSRPPATPRAQAARSTARADPDRPDPSTSPTSPRDPPATRVVAATDAAVPTRAMVLLSAQGMDVAQIVKVAFTSPDRVREVLHNFDQDDFESLYPRYSGGRPPAFTLTQRREINRIALSRPPRSRPPFLNLEPVEAGRVLDRRGGGRRHQP